MEENNQGETSKLSVRDRLTTFVLQTVITAELLQIGTKALDSGHIISLDKAALMGAVASLATQPFLSSQRQQ